MRRGGSRGFMLENDWSDGGDGHLTGKGWTRPAIDGSEYLYGENSMAADRGEGGRKIRCGNGGDAFTANSSIYSFSTDCSSSELENLCNRLNCWLNKRKDSGGGGGGGVNGGVNDDDDDDDDDGYWQQQKLREDDAISQFARNLLKRALSESFVGVELTDSDRGFGEALGGGGGGGGGGGDIGLVQKGHLFGGDDDDDDNSNTRIAADCTSRRFKNDLKLKMVARSLSLELVKRNPRLAARLANGGRQANDAGDSSTTIVTGNWGCGSGSLGDAQLKLLIQWVAASACGQSRILYYTCHHDRLLKLDTLCRILVDRRWSVGKLVRAIVCYTQNAVAQLDNTATMRCVAGQTKLLVDADTGRNGSHFTLFDSLISSDEGIASVEAYGCGSWAGPCL